MTISLLGGKKTYAVTLGLAIVALFLAYSVAEADTASYHSSASYESSSGSSESSSGSSSSSSASSAASSAAASSAAAAASASASAEAHADTCGDDCDHEDHHENKHEDRHEDKCDHDCGGSVHVYKKVIAAPVIKRLPATGSSVMGIFVIAILAILAAFGLRKIYRVKFAK